MEMIIKLFMLTSTHIRFIKRKQKLPKNITFSSFLSLFPSLRSGECRLREQQPFLLASFPRFNPNSYSESTLECKSVWVKRARGETLFAIHLHYSENMLFGDVSVRFTADVTREIFSWISIKEKKMYKLVYKKRLNMRRKSNPGIRIGIEMVNRIMLLRRKHSTSCGISFFPLHPPHQTILLPPNESILWKSHQSCPGTLSIPLSRASLLCPLMDHMRIWKTNRLRLSHSHCLFIASVYDQISLNSLTVCYSWTLLAMKVLRVANRGELRMRWRY